MTEKQSFIFTNYGITLLNIYCIIPFITVVAFNKNNVRDIHILPQLKENNQQNFFLPNLHELLKPFFYYDGSIFSAAKKKRRKENLLGSAVCTFSSGLSLFTV